MAGKRQSQSNVWQELEQIDRRLERLNAIAAYHAASARQMRAELQSH
jgi:hypothetical protein